MKDTKPNWQESLGSLKTTKTGAVVFKEYQNGKVVRSVGGNRIEDLVSTLVAFIATELERERERERKWWVENILEKNYPELCSKENK